MNIKHIEDIKSFMVQSEQIIRDRPEIPTVEERILRARLILEEALETIRDGLGIEVRVGQDDIFNITTLSPSEFDFNTSGNPADLVALADGIADLSYVAYGTAIAAGIDMLPINDEVQRSNLSKFVDGYKDPTTGKWIKGTSYSPANIAPIIAAQQSNPVYAPL